MCVWYVEGGGCNRGGSSKDVLPRFMTTTDAFRRHSPGQLAPAPKLLRSVFITFLRDQAANNSATPEILKSCAVAMKVRRVLAACATDQRDLKKPT